MLGSPLKGEGFIRSPELLEVLHSDIHAAYFALETDKSNQFLRRCLVRSIFSFIEAVVESIKVELRSTVRSGDFPNDRLSLTEQQTLGPLCITSSRPGKFLPLDKNINQTFELAAKIWHLDFRLANDDGDYADFLIAKSARNRLTHPRTFYDVEVTDEDMHSHSIAYMWVLHEFQRIFKLKIESLMQGLSDEDRQNMLKDMGFPHGLKINSFAERKLAHNIKNEQIKHQKEL